MVAMFLLFDVASRESGVGMEMFIERFFILADPDLRQDDDGREVFII